MTKRLTGLFFSLLMAIGIMLVGGGAAQAYAADALSVNLTSFDTLSTNGEHTDSVPQSGTFMLGIGWDATSLSTVPQEGDYFDITLPSNMVFDTYDAVVSNVTDGFAITDSSGNEIAHGQITPGTTASGNGDDTHAGGTLRVTFTSAAESLQGLTGTIRVLGRFDLSQINTGDEGNTLMITSGSQSLSANLKISSPTHPWYFGALHKASGELSGHTDECYWWVHINQPHGTMHNAVITDHMWGGDGSNSEHFTTMTLERGEMNDIGTWVHTSATYDLMAGEVPDGMTFTMDSDNRGFTLNMGDINGEQYRIIADSNYVQPTELYNRIELTTDEKTYDKHENALFSLPYSGGSASGAQANQIGITAVDALDQSTTLPGATFTISGPTESSNPVNYRYMTGDDGTLATRNLVSGTYRITQADWTDVTHYSHNYRSYEVTVNSDGAAKLTVPFQPTMTNVPVSKTWVGPHLDNASATINLLANRVASGIDPLTLNKDNNWAGSFSARQYTPGVNGTEIAYTVSENPIDGYDSAVSGDTSNGFTVTNTNNAKTSVQVTKHWVGPAANGATINLLADGNQSQSYTLTSTDANADKDWTHTFTNLPKYDSTDGHEIVYTVTEDPITGYTSASSGDASTGYIFTNTNDATRNIHVTKVWSGPETQSVTLHLFANGTDTGQTLTLNADNNWQGVFSGVRQYDQTTGNEVNYTVTEDPVANYTSQVTGTMAEGFTIANTNDETTSVHVAKQWVGPAADPATVHLLADGTQTQTATLTQANGWADTFTGLAKYAADGHEIVYTVSEDPIEGYSTSVAGSAAAGYTITNTNNATRNITVTKHWDGPAAGGATINLFANGTQAQTLTLTSADAQTNGDWQGTFSGLRQYDATTGQAIVYTIGETDIDNYTSAITGDANTGFVVTNTFTGAVDTVGDPPVTKTISGDTPSTQSTFTFSLTADPNESTLPSDMAADQMPMPEGANGQQSMTTTIQGSGSSEFGNFHFTRPGTYVYRITEVNTGVEGYTYDPSVYTVTYVVENGTGELTCTRTITKGGQATDGASYAFDNTYKAPEQPTTPTTPGENTTTPEEQATQTSEAPQEQTPAAPEESAEQTSEGTTPQTADTSALPLGIAALGSLAALAVAFFVRRRAK